MKNCLLLTDYKNRIPQITHETISLDLLRLSDGITQLGFKVNVVPLSKFINESENFHNCLILYCSSQYPTYKDYIENALLIAGERGNIAIPNYLLFKCHENKVLQELTKRVLQIRSPKSWVFGTYEEAIEKIKNLHYPLVGKTTIGYGSSGVCLLNNYHKSILFLKKNMKKPSLITSEGWRYFARSLKYFGCYSKGFGSVLLQEYIPVDYDWKILCFFNRLFVLKRFNRKGDFRASGSGLFDFDAAPSEDLLFFALKCRESLGTPWISLDIIEKEDNHYLIEFQAVHFGLTTLVKNKCFYEYCKHSNKWTKKDIYNSPETFFTDALDLFLQERGNLNENYC